MSSNSTELYEFSEYLAGTCSEEGEQRIRTAAHKLYYSMYHLYVETFPDAVDHPSLKGEPLGSHERFIEGLKVVSSSREKPNQVLQCATALHNLKAIRHLADYKLKASFTDGELKSAFNLTKKLMRKYDDHFKSA